MGLHSLVNVLVNGSVVQQSVRDVVPRVFEDKEQSELGQDCRQLRERDFPCGHADRGCHRVEEVDLRNEHTNNVS